MSKCYHRHYTPKKHRSSYLVGTKDVSKVDEGGRVLPGLLQSQAWRQSHHLDTFLGLDHHFFSADITSCARCWFFLHDEIVGTSDCSFWESKQSIWSRPNCLYTSGKWLVRSILLVFPFHVCYVYWPNEEPKAPALVKDWPKYNTLTASHLWSMASSCNKYILHSVSQLWHAVDDVLVKALWCQCFNESTSNVMPMATMWQWFGVIICNACMHIYDWTYKAYLHVHELVYACQLLGQRQTQSAHTLCCRSLPRMYAAFSGHCVITASCLSVQTQYR